MTTIFVIFQSNNSIMVEAIVNRFVESLPMDPTFPQIQSAPVASNIYRFVGSQGNMGLVREFLRNCNLHGHYLELHGIPNVTAF